MTAAGAAVALRKTRACSPRMAADGSLKGVQLEAGRARQLGVEAPVEVGQRDALGGNGKQDRADRMGDDETRNRLSARHESSVTEQAGLVVKELRQ
jgi:hypothetical protein